MNDINHNHTVIDDDDVILGGGNSGYHQSNNVAGGSYNNASPTVPIQNRNMAVTDIPARETPPLVNNIFDETIFVRGYYCVVGGTPMVVRRAYHTNVTGEVFDNIQEKLDPSKGFHKQNIVSIAGSIMDQSPTDISYIQLPNGISSQRIIFMLELQRKYSANDKTSLFYVNGYADKVDFSYDGHLAPEIGRASCRERV